MTRPRAETRLAAWRLKRGVTQESLIRATGISRSTYWRLERGLIKNPPLRYLMNCAIALGCTLDDLIEPEWREWLILDRQWAAKPPWTVALWREAK